jgi:hypothetical protein
LLFVVANLFLLCAPSFAQGVTSTCISWFQPKTYQDAIVSSPDPKNNRPAVIFGHVRSIPAMRIRFLDGRSGLALPSSEITVNYGWRWLEYPYPEHGWGAWNDTSDKLSCKADLDGRIEAPGYDVKPRGWYNGTYTKLPWPHRPTFTGVEIVMVTKAGFARVKLSPSNLEKFTSSMLIVRVFDGWRTETSWAASHGLARQLAANPNPMVRAEPLLRCEGMK